MATMNLGNIDPNEYWDFYHVLWSNSAETKTCPGKCGDALCDKVGCLDVPAWKFRALIFKGYQQTMKEKEDDR